MRAILTRTNRWNGTRAVMRGACMALFVASLVLQAAGTLPEAGFAHVRCAEHGELTHAETPSVTPAAGTRLPDFATGVPRALRGSAPASGTHEHCPYADVLDQPAPTLSAAPALDGVALAAPPRPTAPGGHEPRILRVILDSAPKTSPPLA